MRSTRFIYFSFKPSDIAGSIPSSVRSRGEDGGDMSLPVKIVPPAKKKIVLGECQIVPPSDKHRKKSNVFYRYTCSVWVRTAAILSSIFCSHYDFLHKPNKNNLCSAPITSHRFRTVYFSSILKHVSNFL